MKCRRTMSGVVYAVFETTTSHEDYQYLIYKLDSAEAAGKDDDHLELGHPICGIKKSDCSINMCVFSAGSNLYFCGGSQRDDKFITDYICDAFMVDISTLNSGLELIPISPMESPKHNPLVFGPIHKHEFYVISPSLYRPDFSFEMLDTNTNEWKTLPTPPSRRFEHISHLPRLVLDINASAVCGSFICLSTLAALFVFSTTTREWYTFGHSYRRYLQMFRWNHRPSNLPFIGQAQSLFIGNKNENIFLAPPFPFVELPKVYKLPPIVEIKDFERSDFLKLLGEVEGLKKHWREIPEILASDDVIINIFSFNDEPKVCIVHRQDSEDEKGEDMAIKICDINMIEGAKVKVEKSVTYKRHNYEGMVPRHFFVA